MSVMKNASNKKLKVVVAMSGGVDSSVAAALLKKDGHYITGVFMRCWNADNFTAGKCTAEEDEMWARRAAAKIGISFYSVDLISEYKGRVVDYFISEYRAGRTPNPDIMCNSQIKFGVFLDWAINEFGADYIATGHYARLRREIRNSKSEIRNSKQHSSVGYGAGKSKTLNSKTQTIYKLLRGVDRNKDQSYFLSGLTQEQLARAIFPVGKHTKNEVRDMAREFGLPNATRKDSQGLCFIGKVDIRKFLDAYIPHKKGVVITTDGRTIGTHNGAHYYTAGQRHGLGIGGGAPYYVVKKDVKTNTIVVGNESDAWLNNSDIQVKNIHWIADAPKLPAKLTASIRYRQEPQKAIVKKKSATMLTLAFKEPQYAPAAGQTAVLHKGEEVVGSGIIV